MATIVELKRTEPSVSDSWLVTFVYRGHTVSAPTVGGVRLQPNLVGREVIIRGSIDRDGSFLILSVEPAAN